MQNLIPAPRFASDKNDPTNPCRHFIRSDAFAAKFSMTTELAVFERISAYIKPMKGGPVGGDTVRFADDNDNGDRHEFSFETFNFRPQMPHARGASTESASAMGAKRSCCSVTPPLLGLVSVLRNSQHADRLRAGGDQTHLRADCEL